MSNPKMQGGKDRKDVWDGQSVDNILTICWQCINSRLSLASNWFNVCSYTLHLCRVERIVKTFGMVNANPETIKGSECITIINGFSNLMMEVPTRGRSFLRNQNTYSRCLVPRRGWVLGVQWAWPPCPTIALLRWSASSRSRNNFFDCFSSMKAKAVFITASQLPFWSWVHLPDQEIDFWVFFLNER